MKVLYIYGGNKNKLHNLGEDCKVFLYRVGMGNIDEDNVLSINNSSLLNNIATNSAKDYCEFIYSINKLFLKNNVVYNSKYSLYFIGDISGKRTEIFNTYSNFCNSLFIKDWLLSNDVDKVIFDSCRADLYKSISSILKGVGVNTECIDNKKKNNWYSRALFSNVVFFANVLLGLLFKKIFIKKTKKKLSVIKNIFLTRFPLHLNWKLDEDKYGELAGKDDFYLVNLFTDGMHQKVSFINYVKYSLFLRDKKNIIVLDDFIKVIDIMRAFIFSIAVINKYKHISSLRYSHNGVDLSENIGEELLLSYIRSTRLLMYLKPIYRLTNHYTISNLYYYLHEYSYGKLFTLGFKINSPDTCLVGFQHGPSSKRKLLYMAANEESSISADYLNSFPIPDKVLSEDSLSAQIYKDAGYSGVSLMGKIFRLKYLVDIDRSMLDSKCVLIAPGLHDGEFMMEVLKSKITNNDNMKFILKPHPRANNNYINQYDALVNLEVSVSPIAHLLSKVSSVYVTYSSVAIEAKILDINIEMVELPGSINESPLLDDEFSKSVLSMKQRIY
jgi:hypothetical protein